MMVARSRFAIASATSFAGLLCAAEHCCIVSSLMRREAQSAGIAGNAVLSAASGSAFCCASAGEAASTRMIASKGRIGGSSALQARSGDLAALGLFGEKRDQRDADIRAHAELRQAHLPIAVDEAMLHRHHVGGGNAIGRPFTDDL